MAKQSDFVPTMVSFLQWYFRTLDPAFLKELLGGIPEKEAAHQVLMSIVAKVRGNRSEELTMTAADYGAIMDSVAALHLRTRHGEDAVSEQAVPQ